MHTSIASIRRAARRSMASITVLLGTGLALFSSGCATERSHRTDRPAPSIASSTRLQSPEGDTLSRDPAVSLTSTAGQAPPPAEPSPAASGGEAKLDTR